MQPNLFDLLGEDNPFKEQEATGIKGSLEIKTIELYTGEKVNISICGFNHDVKEDGTKSNVTLVFDFPIDGEFQMNNEWSNIGGWNDSYMNNVLMPRFFRLLPKELQDAIVLVKKKTSIGGDKHKIKTTLNNLFLLSEIEANGTIDYSLKGEGKQYELFKKDTEKVGCGKWYWLRSPCAGSDTIFCYVNYSGYVGNNGASNTYYVRLAFCL
jgi:hypothetical protein